MRRFSNIPPLHVRSVLKKYGLRADKGLGQNFLQDENALEKIALAAEITQNDSVLEIGPGLGSLTRYLAAAAKQVAAVELDADLIPPLEEVLKPYQNVNIIHADILDLDITSLSLPSGFITAANIPYNITSAIIRHLLEADVKPRRIVLTIQKEVAERVCAAPGDMSLLALSVQVYGAPSLIAKIPAGAFHPVPNVDSAILRIDIHDQPRIAKDLLPRFFQLIKAGFAQKRKTLRNSLSAGLHISAQEAEAMLQRAGIDPMRRAETLSIEEWGNLAGR